VDPRATAFAHRDRQYDFLIPSQWEDPADSDRNIDWTRHCFEAMRPYLKEAVYVNNLGDQEHDRVRAAYGVNYDRLAAVKARYDPENVFCLNHNIAPGVVM
jgi:FAD/FMN-containing dehydrogenase